MSRYMSACAAVAALVGCAPVVTRGHDARHADAAAEKARGEVLGLLRHHAQLWSAGDIAHFVEGYAEDCVFISPTGLTRGRSEVLDRYVKRYPDKSAMGTLTLEPLDVRVAVDANGRGSVAVVAAWRLSFDDQPDKEPLSGRTLLVFERTRDGWLIVQDASM